MSAHDIPRIKVSEIKDLLFDRLLSGVPIMVWGDPGIGKTKATRAAVQWATQQFGSEVAYYETSPNTHVAQDYGGYPVPPEPGANSFRLVALHDYERLTNHKFAVVYIDEANTGETDVIAAMLRMISEKRVGQLQLPQHTLFVATANPATRTVNAKEMGDAFLSRFSHYWAEPDLKDFTSNFPYYWGQPTEGIIPAPSGATAKELDDMWRQSRALIASFVRSNPTMLLTDPPEIDDGMGRGYPNPRSWEALSRTMVSAAYRKKIGLPETDLNREATAIIGHAAAQTFVYWMFQLKLPRYEQIINDPRNTPLMKQPDEAYAVITSLSANLVNEIRHDPAGAIPLVEKASIYLSRYIETAGLGDIVTAGTDPLVQDLKKHGLPARLVQRLGIDNAFLEWIRAQEAKKQAVREEVKNMLDR